MTVIAYRDGIMAADSLVVAGDCKTGGSIKIRRRRDGWLIAAAGEAGACEILMEWFLSNRRTPPPLSDDAESYAMLARDREVLFLEASGAKYAIKSAYHAIGSGAPYALAAMALGFGAVEACQVACQLSIFCGGEIQVEHDSTN